MNRIYLQGMIKGLEKMGAKYVGIDENSIWFKVTKHSELNTPESLVRARDAFKNVLGLTLKIKITE